MLKNHSQVLLCILMLCILLLSLYTLSPGIPVPDLRGILDGSYFASLDTHIAQQLPGQARFRQFSLQLGLLGGQWEQNDIFISEDGLIKNIDIANTARVQQNVDSMLRFTEAADVSTYLMLLPTSGAILQEQLPPYTELYNNQKQMIEDIYQQMSGKVTVIDVYTTLFNLRDEYIYYRTENNLTALGGYHVYSILGAKLVGQEVYDFSQFEITYLPGAYYGDLYQTSPYQGVRPDVLSLFRYIRYPREYIVAHLDAASEKAYYTLFPLHLQELGPDMDIYLGGLSAVTNIRISSPYQRSLLVFGDKTALSYLPFLANNYRQVTLVDLSQLNADLAREINVQMYDQILFAYSVEAFDSEIPRLAEQFFYPE